MQLLTRRLHAVSVPPESVGLLGDPTNHTLSGIAMPPVILTTTEDFTTTIDSVDFTMGLVVVAVDIILVLLMEVSSIIQLLTGKVSSLARILSHPNQ